MQKSYRMKFIKVEIQAFRAYDKIEDGTFDFQLSENGQPADFISLYAPNGFGKTSFYDAVEYAYTNNIERFLKNKLNEDIAKSEKNLRSDERQYILKNKNSKLPSHIELLTTVNKINKDITEPRKGGADFKFDETKTINKYFRQVILSQDWISAFLKEDKPEDRYQKFIDYFGDQKMDEYRKTLVSLINRNKNEINQLTQQCKQIQSSLNFTGDTEILTKINDQIKQLNKNNKLFKQIEPQAINDDMLYLTQSITERLHTIELNVNECNTINSELTQLITGGDALVGFKKFKEISTHLEILNQKKKDLDVILDSFEQVRKKSAQLMSIQDKNKELAQEKEQHEKIINLFPSYKQALKLIDDKEKEINTLTSEKKKLEQEIFVQRIKHTTLDTQISSKQHEQHQLNEKILALPKTEKNIFSLESKIKRLHTDIQLKKSELERQSKLIVPVNTLLGEFKKALINIEEDVFPSEFDANFSKHAGLIQTQNQLKKQQEEARQKLHILQKEITIQENFRTELEQFISTGLSIVNHKKMDTCPLCNQKYESYRNLADKIANNKLLSHLSHELLNRKSEIEKTIYICENEINETKVKFIDLVKADIAQNESDIQKMRKLEQGIEKTIFDLENNVKEDTEKLSTLKNSILNKSPKEYRQWADEQLNTLSTNIKEKQADRISLQQVIKDKEEKLQIICNKMKIENENKETLSCAPIINEIKVFFVEKFPGKEVNFQYVQNFLSNIIEDQKKNVKDFENLQQSIKSIENELAGNKKETITSELNELKHTIDKQSKIVLTYTIALKKHTNLDIDKIDDIFFEQEINNNKNKLSEYNNEYEQLTLLSKLKKDLLSYLEFEEKQKIINNLEEQIELKDKVNNKLQKEQTKVAEHIGKSIRSFFYEELINNLYSRIDPHPDYKKIQFVPDFNSSKPKLNVCVCDENNKQIIPNLYFSQAQLNILSLSIFLAKALNAKDDDGQPINCIFIDDPIQSMDSINVLSTIDLLRSIVVKLEKQIIISTHDENFHNLLKKKIPPNLFKSKFLELESFGKVRSC